MACHISHCVIPAVKSAVAGAMASQASHSGAVKITSGDVCVSVIREKLAKQHSERGRAGDTPWAHQSSPHWRELWRENMVANERDGYEVWETEY